jgi:hypothetical protein
MAAAAIGSMVFAGAAEARPLGWRPGVGLGIAAGAGLGLGLAAAATSPAWGYPGYYPDYYYPGYAYDYYDYSPAYTYMPPRTYQSYANPPLQTGRSVATEAMGNSCTTPVKACQLYNPSVIGNGCSCKAGGGRARGTVTQ